MVKYVLHCGIKPDRNILMFHDIAINEKYSHVEVIQ